MFGSRMSRGPSGYAFSRSTDSSKETSLKDGSVCRVFGRSVSERRTESSFNAGNCFDVYGAGEDTMGEPILLVYNSGVEGCRWREWMLIVRLDGRREGSRGDRNGEAGADPGKELAFVPTGTLRLRFLAFRGRLGGERDRRDPPSMYTSSGIVGETGFQSGKGSLERYRGEKGSGSIVNKVCESPY